MMTAPLLNIITDVGMADLFADRIHKKARWDPVNKMWRSYYDGAWRVDHRGHVRELAKETVKEAAGAALEAGDAELAKKILAWHRHQGLSAMLELVKSVEGIPALPQEFDRDGWLLNTLTHTVDLRTGMARAHDPADLLTKTCPAVYDPNAQCPRWQAFLDRIFASNQNVISLLQRIFGMALTGVIREHVFLVFWGTGANGKSTLLHVLLRLVGDYGAAVQPEVFVDRDSDPQGFALADLPGVRVVVAVETKQNRKLNEPLVKFTTGRDRIRVARKYGQPFEFEPVFKPILATNHKPVIEGQDHAIWRRVKLVPFEVTIPDHEQDPELPDKLLEELPGILNWALAGCYEWQSNGLAFPDEVTQATADYRAEQDVLADWIAARCVVRPDVSDEVAGLYSDYVAWCQDNTDQPISKRRFAQALDDHGFTPVRLHRNTVRGRRGICRIAQAPPPPKAEDVDASPDVDAKQAISNTLPSRTRIETSRKTASTSVLRPQTEIPWDDVDEALEQAR